MELISIAHPKFQPWLIEEAKKCPLSIRIRPLFPAKGEYPAGLTTHRLTKGGLRIILRPVKISDEPLLKDFIYSLSDETMYKRFFTRRKDMPHELLQSLFVVTDYTKAMVILALLEDAEKDVVIGVGQYGVSEGTRTAEVALVVRDDYQNLGVGMELLSYLRNIAEKQGLLGFTAEVCQKTLVAHLLKK